MSTREVPARDRADEGEVDPSPLPEPPRPPRRPGSGATPAVPPVTRPAGARAASRGRRRTIVYDDQARRPGTKGPQPRAVEVRRVRRVVRRVEVWTLFRFVVALYACALVVFMTAAIGLWLIASGAGAIPSIENFITQLFALKKFHFKAGQLFLATFGLGLIWVFVSTLMTMVGAVLYNLISDVVGGIEFTILEEEPLDAAGG